jgi:hypothetical protein
VLSTEKDPPAKTDPKVRDNPRDIPRDLDPKVRANPRDPDPKKDPADPKKSPADVEGPKGAPPLKEVKSQLEKVMWGPPMQGGTKHTYDYKVIKWGEARKGDPFTDGTPRNRETTVYPVRLVVEITKTYTDGTIKMETKKQTYIFFKTPDFGDWTFKLKSNDE